MPRKPSIVTVTCISIGTLVGLAVSAALYSGLSSAALNTRNLLATQIETSMDLVEARIDSRLQPAVAQAQWIADFVSRGELDLSDQHQRHKFLQGTLAATPQIGGLAYVTPNGISHSWRRSDGAHIADDWSQRPGIADWLSVGAAGAAPEWREPFWTETLASYVVLHDSRLTYNGKFLGMLGQVIPIMDLTRELTQLVSQSLMTPFVLYDRNRVLAHAAMVVDPDALAPNAPLPELASIDDPVLNAIWSATTKPVPFLKTLERSHALETKIEDRRYGIIYRELTKYGNTPWFIGVHFDVEQEGSSEMQRLFKALMAGLAILAIAILFAILLGRRLSRPMVSIANQAELIGANKIDSLPALRHSRVKEIHVANTAINQMVEGLRERALIRNTLGRYLPEAVARSILKGDGQLPPETRQATVLFSDIESFTKISKSLGPARTVEVLNAYFSAAVALIEQHGGIVTQFQGDGILAVFNIPEENPRHAHSAIIAARMILQCVDQQKFAGTQLNVRIGINTGDVVAGAVGADDRLSYTVHGDAVNTASRIEALNKTTGTRLLVTASTYSLVIDDTLKSCGTFTLRGNQEEVEVFSL